MCVTLLPHTSWYLHYSFILHYALVPGRATGPVMGTSASLSSDLSWLELRALISEAQLTWPVSVRWWSKPCLLAHSVVFFFPSLLHYILYASGCIVFIFCIILNPLAPFLHSLQQCRLIATPRSQFLQFHWVVGYITILELSASYPLRLIPL